MTRTRTTERASLEELRILAQLLTNAARQTRLIPAVERIEVVASDTGVRAQIVADRDELRRIYGAPANWPAWSDDVRLAFGLTALYRPKRELRDQLSCMKDALFAIVERDRAEAEAAAVAAAPRILTVADRDARNLIRQQAAEAGDVATGNFLP